VLDSSAIQLCIQCLTCTARCPRNIDIAGIFEDLKTIATAQERDVPEHVKTFNKAFLSAVAKFGRLPEFYDMATFYVGTLNPKMALGNVGLMVPVLARRKMPLIPRRAKGADEVGRIYKKTMEKAKQREKSEARKLQQIRAAAAEAAAAADAARVAASVAPATAGHGSAAVSGSEVAG